MSLITQILKPEEFTAKSITALSGIPEEYARYVIEQLGLRGIIGPQIYKPAGFNSTTIAILLWEKMLGPGAWNQATEASKMRTIDQVQGFLDQWQQQGVIG